MAVLAEVMADMAVESAVTADTAEVWAVMVEAMAAMAEESAATAMVDEDSMVKVLPMIYILNILLINSWQ